MDEANGDYNLTASSDLIDAGTTTVTGVTLPTTDLDENARVVGGNIDIGPYEFSTTRPTINSLIYTGTATEQNELTFDTSYTLTDGRTISSITYDFLNDGSYVSLNTHTFNTAGTYTVKVKVTDDTGEFSSRSLSVTITPLAFSDMTDEQKLVKAIDPQYYDAITAIIASKQDSSHASGVTVGENNVVLAPSSYNLVTVSDIELTISKISALPTGWTLTSTPFEITDLSIFDSATVVWVYNNNTSAWMAYSSDATMRQNIIDNVDISLLTTIPAGSGVWVQK